MDDKKLKAVMSALDKGDRVLLIPVKGGVRIFVIKREEVK